MRAHEFALNRTPDTRTPLLAALLVGFALATLNVCNSQPLSSVGSDFAVFWAGGKAAILHPSGIYDFNYITNLGGWTNGPHKLRPFVNPPTSLGVFLPFSLVPKDVGFALWTATTLALFVWSGLKVGARWWFVLLPPVGFAALNGQVTLLIGALVLLGLAEQAARPVLAGVLFGIAAAVKPQLVVLVPVALLAEGRWRTLFAAGATVVALALGVTAAFGLTIWTDWLAAMQRFPSVILDDPQMIWGTITPYGLLKMMGQTGRVAFALAPLGVAVVWAVFRRPTEMADRILALLGCAFLVTPYAMNYELALLAPGFGLYIARTKAPRWMLYLVATAVYVTLSFGILSALAAAALPIIRLWPRPDTDAENPARSS